MISAITPFLTDPGCRQFLLQLEADTIVNDHQFKRWYQDNRDELEDAFIESGLPDYDKNVWMRETFVARRSTQSRPAAAHRKLSPTKNSPVRPVGFFSRLFRRKSP